MFSVRCWILIPSLFIMIEYFSYNICPFSLLWENQTSDDDDDDEEKFRRQRHGDNNNTRTRTIRIMKRNQLWIDRVPLFIVRFTVCTYCIHIYSHVFNPTNSFGIAAIIPAVKPPHRIAINSNNIQRSFFSKSLFSKAHWLTDWLTD